MKRLKMKVLLLVLVMVMGMIFVPKVYAENEENGEESNSQTEGNNETGDNNQTGDDNQTENETTTWTDVSNATFSFVNTSSVEQLKNYKIKISGVNFEKDSAKRNYYLIVANSSQKPNIDMNAKKDTWLNKVYSINVDNGQTSTNPANDDINNRLALSGDIYVWLYEEDIQVGKTTVKELVSAKKVERPKINPLGNRISLTISYVGTNWIIGEPINKTLGEQRKIKIKVGLVNDNQVLKSIQKGESNCMSNLLSYAKNAKAIHTEEITTNMDSGTGKSFTDKLNVSEGQYYYSYTQLDDENGKYQPLEDVMLYQGLDYLGATLVNYLDERFTWNLKDDGSGSGSNGNEETNYPTINTNGDNTTAPGTIPQTGISTMVIVIIVAGIAIAIVSYMQTKKYRDIK